MKTIGITLGDQAGVGPEIVKAALADERLSQGVKYRIIGKELQGDRSGNPSIETAQVALDALEESVKLLQSGDIDAVVTAPVAKEWLHKVGFDFPGQTEFYADRLACADHAMCLTGARLTVALVTVHVPVSTVPESLCEEEIIRIGRLLESYCEKREGRAPQIAVCGLNPHAGENGAFGKEDEEIVVPAVEKLNEGKGEPVFSGPHPPDTIFKPASEGKYDAVLCMYHDQGLIPLKLLDFDTGVNTTLGLPYPRTSPDHGTAFDIAGKGVADHTSMLHAIKLAVKLA